MRHEEGMRLFPLCEYVVVLRNPQRTGLAQDQKGLTVDAVLAAGIVHGVETGDRTTHAVHLEAKKHADRLRRPAHDVVDQIIKTNGHAHPPS
jgi:hypothetical protein